MVATLSLPRTARTAPIPMRPDPPDTELGRAELWGDAVMAAVLALRNQLTSPNEAVVAAAANSILDLERTRMRHNGCISGTDHDPRAEAGGGAYPSEPPDEPAVDEGAPLAAHVRELRAHMEHVVRRPMGEAEASAYIGAKLDRWEVRASQIHPGEFVQMLGLMGERPGAGPAEAD